MWRNTAGRGGRLHVAALHAEAEEDAERLLKQVTTEVEPGRLWRWKVGGIPATGHRVEPVGDDPAVCHVVIEVPVWAAPYAGVATVALRNVERLAVAWAG